MDLVINVQLGLGAMFGKQGRTGSTEFRTCTCVVLYLYRGRSLQRR
jgi:hypothetical protein